MIPVLAVEKLDPSVLESLGLTCSNHPDGLVASFRDQKILVVDRATRPDGFLPFRLDHVALGVDDVDAEAARLVSLGASYAADFTPDGPADIPQFWESGVRIAFFEAPGDAPLELCQNLAATAPSNGHDHYSIRSSDIAQVAETLAGMGATPVASFQVPTEAEPVTVSFFRLGDKTFEVFDEPGGRNPAHDLGWVGLVHAV